MPTHNQESSQAQSERFLSLVDEECRRWGGKHLLTPAEYFDIVNRMYLKVYGVRRDGSAQV